jgi:hypothetical protein
VRGYIRIIIKARPPSLIKHPTDARPSDAERLTMSTGHMPRPFSSRTLAVSMLAGRPLYTPRFFVLAMPTNCRSFRILRYCGILKPEDRCGCRPLRQMSIEIDTGLLITLTTGAIQSSGGKVQMVLIEVLSIGFSRKLQP